MLRSYPADAINYAFREHTKISDHMPMPANIMELADRFLARRSEDNQMRQRLAEKDEIKRRLASGEQQYTIEDVRKAMAERKLLAIDSNKKEPA